MRPGYKVLAGMIVITVFTVAYVHRSQTLERKTMREAVYRDIEKLGR